MLSPQYFCTEPHDEEEDLLEPQEACLPLLKPPNSQDNVAIGLLMPPLQNPGNLSVFCDHKCILKRIHAQEKKDSLAGTQVKKLRKKLKIAQK